MDSDSAGRSDLDEDPVWKYFDFPQTNTGRVVNRNQVVCQKCSLTLKYDGRTRDMKQHLLAEHKELQTEIKLSNDDFQVIHLVLD